MNNIRFITRSDDAGSSHSANLAIAKVIDAGFIKNVSLMACGPAIEAAAELLAHRKDVCFGMHTTLNAEWDRVKWKPLLPPEKCSGLIDGNGYFLSHPTMFLQTKPTVETVMQEVDAQLERLHKLGFSVSYIDSHMFPERYVDGLSDAMADFARRKGLIDHMYFYRLPPWGLTLCNAKDIHLLPEGQYLGISHPSLDTEEMQLTGNTSLPGAAVAAARTRETELLSDPAYFRNLESAGMQPIRYDEAGFDKRLTVDQLICVLSGK